jgi:hypothetical protein
MELVVLEMNDMGNPDPAQYLYQQLSVTLARSPKVKQVKGNPKG